MAARSKYFLQLVPQVIQNITLPHGNIWQVIGVDSENVRLSLCAFQDGKESGAEGSIAETFPRYAIADRRAFAELSHDEYELLIAVKEPEKRMLIYETPNWLREGVAVQMNSSVTVTANDNSLMTGIVRFCGAISGGRMFGVELDLPFHRKGASDGMFRKIRYFTCDEDCAMFVNLFRIRLNPSELPMLNRPSGSRNYSEPPISPTYGTSRACADTPLKDEQYPLQVGERIVWISDDGPECGTVKWIGRLPDAVSNEATVGVEFDRAIGSGTGRYKSQRLFNAQRNHASLIPIMGLMKYTDFFPEQREFVDTMSSLNLKQPRSQSDAALVKLSLPTGHKESSPAPSTIHEQNKAETKSRMSQTIKGRVMPPSIASDAVDSLCGKERGLQGQSSVCGLESVIYALFAFSSSFDNKVYDEQFDPRELKGAVRSILVEQIINPLRAVNYVSADKISRFKELYSMIGSVDSEAAETDASESGLGESGDPADDLRGILHNLLGINFLISPAAGKMDYVFRIDDFDWTLASEGLKHALLEDVQHALERVHVTSQYRLLAYPSPVFIIEVKRNEIANTNTSRMIFPNPIIDISHIVTGFPLHCKICGKSATLECANCLLPDGWHTQTNLHRLADATFCHECSERFHQRPDRKLHNPTKIPYHLGLGLNSGDIADQTEGKMELFAIISLIDGHYVSFVASGSTPNSPWLCYDGMAKRTIVDRRGVFIPEVRRCQEISNFFNDFPKSSFSTLPELLQNMVRGMRLCFYRPHFPRRS